MVWSYRADDRRRPVLSAAWAVGCGLLALGTAATGGHASEAGVDPLAGRVAEARRLAAACDGLWPGLAGTARESRILVIRPDRPAILADPRPGEGPPPEGFVAAEARPGWYRTTLPVSGGAPRPALDPRGSPDAVLDARGGGHSLAHLERHLGATGEHEAAVAWIVGGLFRAWIAARREDLAAAGTGGPGAAAPPTVPALTPAEAALLLRALDAPKAARAREAAREFASRRRQRLATVARERVAALERAETRDGLALYTAYQALLAGRHGADTESAGALQPAGPRYRQAPAMRDGLIADLRRAAASEAGTTDAALSGFALGLVLDRTVHGWRRHVTRTGASPAQRILPSPRAG